MSLSNLKMTNQSYRTIFGAILLVALYFEFDVVILGLVSMLFFEGITNLRIPIQINRLLGVEQPESVCANVQTRFSFESERAWRLTVGMFLLVSYFLLYSQLWFFAWFMGFAILGAGVSGVCPVLIVIKRFGFQ